MRSKLVLLLVLSLLLPLHVSGNKGGVGNGLEDMQCGGACHGDANQNATSNLQLNFLQPESVWVGQPTEITVQISGFGVLHDVNQVGVFLLSSTNANGDIPTSNGWEILSDGFGGVNNYIEYSSVDSPTLSHTWILRPDEIGEKTLYVSVHHGDNTGSNAGRPFSGVSQPFLVSVEPIPDNLPRLHPDYKPPTSREIGQTTELCIATIDTDDVTIEWREPLGSTYQVDTVQAGDCWTAELPAALSASTLEWRALLDGEGPQQSTPWFSLASVEPSWEADETALRLQSIAHVIFFFGLVLLVRKPRRIQKDSKQYETSLDDGLDFVSKEHPPLPPEGLPQGWTMEDWRVYGLDYLEGRL
ncbi:MAG: hypothetical protein CMA67_01505 [Euryarchaeota archaeon]|nr:hypothetical protein [Euryarchaeota archaeon]